MTIETKYNIGDEIWVKDEGEDSILNGRVVNILIDCNYGHHITTIYVVSFEIMRFKLLRFLEWQLFPTKEELLKSL